MEIDKLKKGIVIDHITPGKSMAIYSLLQLDKADFTVAIIKNVKSKNGKKDLLKIENTIDVDLHILGAIDPNITINIIENGTIISKTTPSLPNQVDDLLKCINPRCITSTENDIIHSFRLANKETGLYRCTYCEADAKL